MFPRHLSCICKKVGSFSSSSHPPLRPPRDLKHSQTLKTKPGRWGRERDRIAGQNPPLSGGWGRRNCPKLTAKYRAKATVWLLRGLLRTDNWVLCQGLPCGALHLQPFSRVSPRLTPPPEGGWYVLDDSKSLKRAREGGFRRFGLDRSVH